MFSITWSEYIQRPGEEFGYHQRYCDDADNLFEAQSKAIGISRNPKYNVATVIVNNGAQVYVYANGVLNEKLSKGVIYWKELESPRYKPE